MNLLDTVAEGSYSRKDDVERCWRSHWTGREPQNMEKMAMGFDRNYTDSGHFGEA